MSTNWDAMREFDEVLRKFKEEGASEKAVDSAAEILFFLAGPGGAPYKDGNRLFNLTGNAAEDDEWRLPLAE